MWVGHSCPTSDRSAGILRVFAVAGGTPATTAGGTAALLKHPDVGFSRLPTSHYNLYRPAAFENLPMAVIISLLRGVNLGGNKLVPMADLRTLCTGLRLRNVQTHLQSGNVVFHCNDTDVAKVSERIVAAIERKFGFHVDVVTRTPADLENVIARNPFARTKGIEPAKLLVHFLPKALEKETREKLLQLNGGPEDIRLGNREFYVYFPEGQGRSRLQGSLDRVLNRTSTARNWNTVTKLFEIARAMETNA